eukprot:1192502-Prorocentrum_minimum.AAC.2
MTGAGGGDSEAPEERWTNQTQEAGVYSHDGPISQADSAVWRDSRGGGSVEPRRRKWASAPTTNRKSRCTAEYAVRKWGTGFVELSPVINDSAVRESQELGSVRRWRGRIHMREGWTSQCAGGGLCSQA